jgi:hypothetical protein
MFSSRVFHLVRDHLDELDELAEGLPHQVRLIPLSKVMISYLEISTWCSPTWILPEVL